MPVYRVNRSKFSPALGPSWYSCFISLSLSSCLQEEGNSMPDEEPTDSASERPPEEPLAGSNGQGGSNQNPPPNIDEGSTPDDQGRTERLERDIRTGERWLIGVTAAGVIVNIFIACFYYSQLGQMREATEAATKSANAAEDSFEINDGNFDRMMARTIDQTAAQIQSAKSAEDAAKIARGALWASEGANVYTDNPQFNTGPHRGRIFVINSGHMASGPAQITVHVITSEVDPKTGANKPLEYHWSTKRIGSVPLGSNYTVWLNLPSLTPFGLVDGTRMVLLGGSIDYSIGIGVAPKRTWQFCYMTQARPGSPSLYESTPCDPVVIDSWKVAQGYPAHQEPFPEQQDMWPVTTPQPTP
jgi:hypothetical protein